jgi:hypothetical protein
MKSLTAEALMNIFRYIILVFWFENAHSLFCYFSQHLVNDMPSTVTIPYVSGGTELMFLLII